MAASYSSALTLGPLVSATQVLNAAKSAGALLRFVDASWHLPGPGRRDAASEFKSKRIPSAALFDIDEIADRSSSLPHMLPSADLFATRVSGMGIDNSSHVIVYTQEGCFSAARCWWTFRVFGHEKVSILNGGLPSWEAAGGEIETGDIPVLQSTRPSSGLVQKGGNTYLLDRKGFQAKLVPSLVKTSHQVRVQMDQGLPIIDARSYARFRAEAPEPRPGLAGGHIPGSTCVPATELLEEGDVTKFKSASEIASIFEKAGVDVQNPSGIVTTCGSGVTAAVLAFGLHLVGRDVALTGVYDGSWAEWGASEEFPKEK